MYPSIYSVPLYYLTWLVAAVTCVSLGVRWATRARFPAGSATLALVIATLSIALGSKIFYLLEGSFFPLDDYVPISIRGPLHGFRIPGGVVALALTMPIVCKLLGLQWREFGDALIPLAAMGLVFIRLGCFLNGCCFGRVSSVPWAIAFPRSSWVYWYHRARLWIPPSAQSSLPVHPLQLYFLLAALVTLGVLLWQGRRAWYPGSTQFLFYFLFFGTTALLEPLRENYLTLNNWLTPIAAMIAGGVLVGQGLAHQVPLRAAGESP